ncbi:MAG: peptide ligase PGM1-related protein, partial [Actinomycetota bacterium]
LFDIVVRHGLHFDQSRQVGVVFHMISALPQHGRIGLTAIGESHDQAQELFERTVAALDEETRQTSAG